MFVKKAKIIKIIKIKLILTKDNRRRRSTRKLINFVT
jgi:hypothetical protein